MRAEPCARQHQGRPPSIGGKHHCGQQAADHLDQARRDEVHRDAERRTGDAEVEVARHREVRGEGRVLEMSHPRGAYAGDRQLIIEPCGGAAAEIRTDSMMQRGQRLEQYENRAHGQQRHRERGAALHGADQHAHRDGKQCRKQSAKAERRPPGDREPAIRFKQNAGELPFGSGGNAIEDAHSRITL